MSRSSGLVERSLLAATVLNFLLAALKITAGLMGDSLSLLGDGIDSGSDVVAGIFSYLAMRLVSRPATHSFSYGFGRAETLASWLAGSLIFVIAVQLILQSVLFLFDASKSTIPQTYTIYIVFVSILSKLALSLALFWVYKHSQSSLVRATAVNMRADVLLSLSVLAGIAGSLIGNTRLYDAVFAFLIGLWILKDAYEIFRETFIELMDGIHDEKLYRKVVDAVLAVNPRLNPHRMRIRKIAQSLVVSLDIEVDGKLSVFEGHSIAQKVEDSIKKHIENVYDVLVHVEPYGNREAEQFGVSEKSL